MPTDSPRSVVPLTPTGQPAPTQSFYEAVGGEATFKRLTDAFYEEVAGDEIMRPLYPEEDLAPAARRLQMFLEQYWGGPHTYSEERGHPRLRMRHAPFTIGERERDAWLRCMRSAMDTVELAPEYDQVMWEYMERAADFMRNS
ncbi:globin [Glycomyces buryatensis]|uniref:Group 2 truncated hemoglobin GlbO n=1 Tax=Glycomyces buryatensis TaxID=2570927 RepID=A0A4S8Q9J0_9ACTN|nr:globin [Glycomyces buryatensis]THV39442.1 globin [Glycomyces buryatensis]